MSYEVELKAWVDDRAETERKIRGCCTHVGSYEKHDTYLRAPVAVRDRMREIRIRRVEHAGVITLKEKNVLDGIEVNNEREFTVSDVNLFQDFLLQSGFVPFGTKEKTGERYEYDGTVVELGEVKGLGVFLEVERVVESDEPSEIESARSLVLSVFQRCGGDPAKIEPASYLELLGFRRA